MDAPLAFESHFVKIGKHSMHYLDEGEGEVVLLIHGNPTWCFYYRNLVRDLSESFRVIAPDFIGCGLSDHPEDSHFRAVDRINHLQEFVEKLGLEKYSLVMHDWGGAIGTGLAVRNIPAVQKIVYLNTTLTETETLPFFIKTSAKPIIGKWLTQRTKRFLRFTTRFGVAKKLPKAIRNAYAFPYRTAARRTAIWDFVADIPFDSTHPSYAEMLDLAGKLPELQHVPVKIVWGLKDPCFHRQMLDKVSGHFPNADILEIPNASHLVLEDAPEVANQAIYEFLLGEAVAPSARRPDPSDEGKPNALFRAFEEVVLESPGDDAVISPLFISDTPRYSNVTYRDLAELVNKYQRGLSDLGLSRGDKVLMLVPPGIDFLGLGLAVMGRGAIPIFIDPGIGKEKLFSCIRDINPDVFIGSPRAQLLRYLKKSLFPSLKFHITATDWVPAGSSHLGFLKKYASKPLEQVASTGTCFIAYTSGATGTPKGVRFTDEMLVEQLRIFREELGLKAGSKDLPLLPIFSLFNVALGICSVFPPLNPSKPLAVEPWKVLKLIHTFGIKYSFGSPTLWNKIGEYAFRTKGTLEPLEKIFMAGAPVPRKTLELVQGMIGDGKIYTPYGATEALPVALVSSDEVLGNEDVASITGETGTFVGSAVNGVEIRVIRSMQGPIESIDKTIAASPLEIGEIIVRGKNVSPGYFELPEADALSKIPDGETFWHRIGDVGYLTESGALYFCGRKAHIVKSASKTYYSVPVERVFNSHEKVYRSALVSIADGREVGIVIEPYPNFWPDALSQQEVFVHELKEHVSKDPQASSIKKIYFYRSFPVDSRHNAKIFRDELSEWATKLERQGKAA